MTQSRQTDVLRVGSTAVFFSFSLHFTPCMHAHHRHYLRILSHRLASPAHRYRTLLVSVYAPQYLACSTISTSPAPPPSDSSYNLSRLGLARCAG